MLHCQDKLEVSRSSGCTSKGRASLEGYLARPSSGTDAWVPFWSSLFGTEAQALDLVHWRVPPAGRTWQRVSRIRWATWNVTRM